MRCFKFLLLLIIVGCSNNKHKSDHKIKIDLKIDTLRYSYTGFNNGLQLDLLSDGRFINERYLFSCFGSGERKKVLGTYKLDDVNLILSPKTIELTEYSSEMEIKPITRSIKYGVDSLKIKTNFKLIRWDNKKILLSESFDNNWSFEEENDFLRFADYFNSGLEPESSGMYLVKSTKDSIFSKLDIKQIPKKWRKYYLNEPLNAKIKSITKVIDPEDNQYFHWQIELDKGRNNGIFKNISFSTEDDSIYFHIDSVENNRSFGKYYMPDFTKEKYSIGTEVKTKWE